MRGNKISLAIPPGERGGTQGALPAGGRGEIHREGSEIWRAVTEKRAIKMESKAPGYFGNL